MKIKKGKSLCFFSAKGGVGKTVNILNLAGIFKQLEKKVVVIDMDLYSGAVATYINIKSKKNVYELSEDIINNRYEDFSNYTVKFSEYIDILPAPKDPRYANKFDIRTISDIIHKAELTYDVVLIDTNHALNDINLSILQNVNQILFVTTNDPLDLTNLKSLLSIFKELEFKNYKILLNNSRDPFKSYFSLYDIKHIIKHNISYTLSVDLFMKDMEKHIMNSYILTLDKKFSSVMSNDYHTFLAMATDLLEGDNEDE